MAEDHHFENRYIAISQWKIIRFSWNFVHSSRFWTGWSHVIKNEKVALDRLRVRQNVFLVKIKLASCHLLLYVVYTCQKSFSFINAFACYKQKCKLAPFNLAHPVDCAQRGRTSAKASTSTKCGLIRVRIRMSAGSLPKCCWFTVLLASFILASVLISLTHSLLRLTSWGS